ncbi:MAG: 4Fe-4S binding protein [Bacteroidales bacterium]|nr:4Fe-4S binding protein [Bacteroidales bacterium]
MNLHQIIFSPTGGTRRVCENLCQGIGMESIVTDLCVKAADVRLPNIKEDDLVVIAMPVFAGRVPALAVERLRRANPHGAKCVVVVVFGNRAYDDALLELKDVATEMGFRVIAAVAASAEHSIIRKYGKGRPDSADEQALRRFGADIVRKAVSDDCTMPQVPGNRPYKKGGKVPQPQGRRGCNGCGVCAKHCPADAIPLSDPKTVDSAKCISCMKCVSVCPKSVRKIGAVMNFLATQGLKKVCATRKENELYI